MNITYYELSERAPLPFVNWSSFYKHILLVLEMKSIEKSSELIITFPYQSNTPDKEKSFNRRIIKHELTKEKLYRFKFHELQSKVLEEVLSKLPLKEDLVDIQKKHLYNPLNSNTYERDAKIFKNLTDLIPT